MKPTSGPVKIFISIVILSFLFIIIVFLKVTSIVTPDLQIKAVLIDGSNPVENVVINVRRESPTTILSPSSDLTEASNVSTTTETFTQNFLFMDEGQSWKDPFCDEFLSNKFSVKMTPCDSGSNRVLCFGSPFDDKMGSCFISKLVMDPKKFHHVMQTNRDSVEQSNSLWLNRNSAVVNPCPGPEFSPLEKYMVGGDYVKRLAKTSILSVPKGKCERWINGTTFIFMGFDTHIYFKYLSWFSLHNGIINFESNSGKKPSLIIRLPQTKGEFTHSLYEQKLFQETKLMSLYDFSQENTGITCFENVIITPWAYSTSAFRCKMADAISRLRNRCYNCNSRGLPGTRYLSFRRRALAACSLEDEPQNEKKQGNDPQKIVLEIRKPYLRHSEDSLSHFHRTLLDPKSLLNGLREEFPNSTVEPMIAEEMSLCDQIRLVHRADVLIGVHGAGLVHLWWLKDHALLFELVPRSQMANPSFKMLSALTGRRYYEYNRLQGGEMEVIVDVKDVIKELRRRY